MIENLIDLLEVRLKMNPDDVVRSDWVLSELKLILEKIKGV